jgi:hypothetical protein
MIKRVNPKKTIKVLYLYMTIPLLLVAGVMWLLVSFSSGDEKSNGDMAAKSEPASVTFDDSDAGSGWGTGGTSSYGAIDHASDDRCMVDSDCYIGEICRDGECFNPLWDITDPIPEPPKAETPSGISSAGWAAIIASVMGGLTGLLGAITQTVLAFLAMRERKRKR